MSLVQLATHGYSSSISPANKLPADSTLHLHYIQRNIIFTNLITNVYLKPYSLISHFKEENQVTLQKLPEICYQNSLTLSGANVDKEF